MENQNRPMDNVSPSAYDLAAGFTIMGFPYSQAIYKSLLKKNAGTEVEARLHEALKPDHLFLATLSEARTRLTDRLVKETGITQILELAAGLAPIGLMWTANPGIKYVEMDLPAMSKAKMEVVQGLMATGQFAQHPNLHFEPGDARKLDDLQIAMKQASHHMLGEPEGYNDSRDYRALCRQPKWINLTVPGNACGLDPKDYNDHSLDRGYDLNPHNVDSSFQQLSLLAGLAKLHELAEKDL